MRQTTWTDGPRRRGVAVGLATVLALVLLPGTPPAGVASAEAVATRPEHLEGSADAAAADAKRLGKPVEVLSARTETSTTVANPDGGFTLSVSAVPERVRVADGSWAPVDLRLKPHSGGGYAPAASPADVVFSGGGSGPLAQFADQGRSFELGWPGTLPAPTVSGDTATYASVLPDVDLRVTATIFGFSEVLVVKTPEAARNPAIAQIEFSTRTSGVTVHEAAQNGVDVIDGAGEQVFHAGTPQMWDSTGTAPAASQRAQSGTSAGAARLSMAAAAPDGARTADIDTRVTPGTLTLVPDQAMLTSPSTRFPVFIDPEFTRGRKAYAFIDKSHPTTAFWNKNVVPRAGKDPDDGVTIRSMFRMDTGPLPKGAYVDKAVFTITGTWTPQWSCSARTPVELWLTAPISGNETWNNFADSGHWLTSVDSKSVSLGHDGCGVRPVEFDALTAARKAAAAGWNRTTLGLRAPATHESDTDYWKRFKLDPKLEITYNQRPNAPSQLKVQSKTCSANSWPLVGRLSGRQAPWLQATVSDPNGDTITRTQYEWGTYDPQTGVRSKVASTFDETNHSNGVVSKAQIPATGGLADGTYYFMVRAYDTWLSTKQGIGHWSQPCYFTVDGTSPDTTITIEPEVQPDGSAPTYVADQWGGGIGQAGRFTISTPAGEGNDVVTYRWALGNDQPTEPVAADADHTAIVTVKPASFGPVVLYVRGEDAAGNKTSLQSYRFKVAPPVCPDGVSKTCPEMAAGYWRLDGASADSAADASSHGRRLVLGTGTSQGDGRLGKAVRFNGTTGCGTTQTGIATCGSSGGGAVPVVRTDQSFTVSAWVKLRAVPTRNMVVVAQGGTHTSAFALYYKYIDSATRHWGFLMTRPDVTSSTKGFETRRAASNAENAPDTEWTHLTGVYDSVDGTLRVYVDGTDVTDSDIDQPNGFHQNWNAAGSLQIGRTWYNDGFRDWFDGQIQDVHLFPGALEPAQIGDEADPAARG